MHIAFDRRNLFAAIAAAILAVAGSEGLSAQPRPLDVPYVPTPEHIVEAMLKLAKPTKDDFLVDLGCGDGRIVVTAARTYGVRGFGVDLNPERIKEARANAAKAGVTDKVEFIEGDLFKTDFKKATVLTMYLLPQVNMALRPQILEMKPGTRIVSHAFHMEDWEADKVEKYDFRTVYHWVVPADVAGRWAGTAGGQKMELTLQQKFQKLTGSAMVDGKPMQIARGRVAGETVLLTLEGGGGPPASFEARLEGGKLTRTGVSLERR